MIKQKPTPWQRRKKTKPLGSRANTSLSLPHHENSLAASTVPLHSPATAREAGTPSQQTHVSLHSGKPRREHACAVASRLC